MATNTNISISYDRLARVDGSARFAFGQTTALASLSGPIEARLASEHPSRLTLDVLVRPLSGVPATQAKARAAAIRAALEGAVRMESAPRSLVQVVVQELGGGRQGMGKAREREREKEAAEDTMHAAMLNAASLALLDAASVPMRGVVAAVGVVRFADGRMVLSLAPAPAPGSFNNNDNDRPEALGVFAFIFSDSPSSKKTTTKEPQANCVYSSWKSLTPSSPSSSGDYTSELAQARELARGGAKIVCDAMRRSLASRGRGRGGNVGVEKSVGGGVAVHQEDEDAVGDADDDDKMEI